MMEELSADVAIVGGGPAGLSAALALRSRGVSKVVVLEREGEAGGATRHCGHPPFGLREFGRVMTGPRYAEELRERAARAGAAVRLRSSVVALEPGGGLTVASPEGPLRIKAARVLLATGVRETSRAGRLVSGERPIGVMNTGAFQSYIHLEHKKPFERPVIVGTELVGLSAILTCLQHGIQPAAIVESAAGPVARWPLNLFPRLAGIKAHYSARISDIAGRPRVSNVEIEAGGNTFDVACDGVLFTGRFLPEAALVCASHLAHDKATGGPGVDQFGRCSDPVFFAAGNLLRPVETAGWCFREGRRTGLNVADDLAGDLPPAEARVILTPRGHVRYVVPQMVSLSSQPSGSIRLQLRVDAPVSGRLTFRSNGTTLAKSSRLAARPERRVLATLPQLELRAAHSEVEIGFDDEQ